MKISINWGASMVFFLKKLINYVKVLSSFIIIYRHKKKRKPIFSLTISKVSFDPEKEKKQKLNG